jgi:hypothetical protein
VELTGVGVRLLAKAEFALAEAENEVLAALDDTQRETLYSLLQQAATGAALNCSQALNEDTS